MKFFTTSDGDYTINLEQISDIQWDWENNSCEVYLSGVRQYTIDGEDFERLLEIPGLQDLRQSRMTPQD